MKINSLDKKDDGLVDIDIELTAEEEEHYNKLMKETGKSLGELITVDDISNLLIEQYKDSINEG
jgi:hypothetical protein